jgi:type IV pilus assembly protein PilC
MKRFKYRAQDKNGKEVKGILEGKSAGRIVESLQGKDLLVIDVREEGIDLAKLSEINIGGVPIKDKVLFMRQFATMISAGISLNKSLDILSQQVTNPFFARVIKEVLADVEGGSSLAGAFRKHKGVFDNVVLGLLDAAEATGNLEEVLRILADELEEKAKLQAKIKSAFTYPAIIVVVMIAVIVLLMVILVPVMSDLYADFDAELPLVTRVTIGISEAIISYWWLILIVLGMIIVGIKLYIDTPRGQRAFHLFLLKLPLFGNLMIKIQLTQFTRTLALLLVSGLSIVEALRLTSESLSNVHFQSAVMDAKDEVEKGMPLAVPLSRSTFFPLIISQMVAVGEESGALDGILRKMGTLFNDEVNNIAGNLATLLEPVMLIVMGSVIGFIAMAVYSPMFGIAEVMF